MSDENVLILAAGGIFALTWLLQMLLKNDGVVVVRKKVKFNHIGHCFLFYNYLQVWELWLEDRISDHQIQVLENPSIY